MADKFSFKFDIKPLQDGVDTILGTKVEAAVRMYAETAATKLESYMKSNRPWTDRTGSAKARLSTSVQETSNGLRIALAHGVDYGIWLELANEKKYAIIQPTIYSQSAGVLEGLENLFGKLR